MRFEWRNFFVWLISAVVFGLLFSYLVSCSAAYHLNKYQSKGGICGKIDTVKVLDSIPYVINDTVVYRYFYKDSLYVVNDRIVPRTHYEIKTDYKIKWKTLKVKETIVKNNTKVEKANDRKALIWLAMAFLAVVAIYLIKRT